jgi:hypothetical protein
MIDIPWSQIAGAVAGGAVGGFSGFVASSVQQRSMLRRARRNVASALAGELEALRISLMRLNTVEADTSMAVDGFYRHFRAERDYSPIFRSLGSSIGLLDSPLPRDLAHWYTGLAVTLERAREMYGLTSRTDERAEKDWQVVSQLQREGVRELVRDADDLISRLTLL